MDLSNKVALVTGASGGLGSAISKELAKSGADIGIHYYQNRQNAEALQQELIHLGTKSHIVSADIRKPEDVEAMVKDTVSVFGGIDILINNAGVADQEAPDWDLESWCHLLDVNLTGKFLCARAAHSYLEERSGVIVNISSTSGYNPSYAYGVTKVGVNGLTFWLARLLAPKVRVVGIAPGYIEAGINGADDEETRTRVAQMTLLKRPGKPDDVAKAVAWIASSEASYITGETLMISGGLYLRL